MRVIVCGGRDYSDAKRVSEVLSGIGLITHLWHGNARGADLLADKWARRTGINVKPVPADWKKRHYVSKAPSRGRC